MFWQTLDSAPLEGTMVGNILGNNFSIVDVASLSATGNITAGNFIGNGSQLTGLPAGYTNSDVANLLASFGSNSISTTGNITGGNISITGQTITTGNVTGGNLITAGLVSLSSITKTGSNGVGNIGSTTNTFDTVFARATSALYADLAEKYVADDIYSPGTVVVFGGSNEVTISTVFCDHRVAGVVSSNPAYIMNAGLEGENVVTVALTGRVPCRVRGPVAKGDLMVSSDNGYATACNRPELGTIIGKSLENFEAIEGVIEIVVGIR
jgi:hypothetical protein